jgi:hypothetical protein
MITFIYGVFVSPHGGLGGPPSHESDHSPSAASKVKETCNYTSTPPYVFMA